MEQTLSLEDTVERLKAKLFEEEAANQVKSEILQLLEETSKAITSEVELEKLVQRITDKATELSHAQFGAFFYNVEKEEKEYLLYTISGVPKENFTKFPLPRVTKIFAPTFEGRGTVRYDDVTKQPHYGDNPPYHGMPKGHLPVRSYLAVPVISPINQSVVGGLFLGHAEPGVFTEREQKIVEGIALQGAIAMGNARLFEEKKLAEVSLRHQKELYRNILNSTFDSILILNPDGTIAEANEVTLQLFDKRKEQLTGRSIRELLVFFDPRILNVELLSENPLSFNSQGLKQSVGIIDIECRARVFSYRDAPHVLVVLRDITEQVRAENDLKKSRKFSETISETSPVVLWLTNENGELSYINSLWCKWTGADIQDQYGFGWFEFIHEEDRQMVLTQFKLAFERRLSLDLDFRVVSRNGSCRDVNLKAEPVANVNNFFSGMAGSISDITEKKKIQRELDEKDEEAKRMLEIQVKERTADLEKTNDELLQFTSIASHDLKEPVRKISIFAKMLRNELIATAKERELKRLDNIINSSDRMMNLINELLTFSRLSHAEVNYAQLDLNSIGHTVLDDLQLAIASKDAKIRMSLLPTMEGISLQLGQVFQNLISNSLKFSKPGHELTINIHSEDLDGERFKLVYSDTGIGFNNAYAEKIFNVFQRLHTRDEYDGTGIGLSIVKKIIVQHNGTISAKGEEGRGAEFTITLPYKQPARSGKGGPV